MKAIAILVLVAVLAASGCIGQAPVPETGMSEAAVPGAGQQPAEQGILDFELRDVRTGQAFKLSDFGGKVVVVEAFAVWCPLCLDQQREIKKAEERLASPDVVSVSLDVDPNEDEARVLGHLQRNGFGWRFAISPPEMSKLLADEFGFNVLNPPSTPIIIIDRQQQSHLLRFGVKPASELITEIQKYL